MERLNSSLSSALIFSHQITKLAAVFGCFRLSIFGTLALLHCAICLSVPALEIGICTTAEFGVIESSATGRLLHLADFAKRL
jgi:hypothetical protein